MSLPNATFGRQTHRADAEAGSPLLQWPLAPKTIRLDLGQIHLWAAALNEFVDRAPELGTLLSPDETARAEEFRFVEDRSSFVIRRGLLRLILSRYLDQLPSTIVFQHGPYGKPEVQRDGTGTPIFFNDSHSGEITVCAITSTCPVGVDVERTQGIPEIEMIAKRFFSPGETRTLMGLSGDSRLQAFYACWTRKEAFLKATGEGIAESLAKVEVTLAPGDKPAVVSASGDPHAHDRWQLQPFSPACSYAGCLAYKYTALALNQWRVARSAT